MGITPKERDWLVVGASEEEMLSQGFKRADAEFPVFIHPETGDEYALARTEIKSGSGYKGFEVDASPNVTLEQDLIRRDLTINAMARDEEGNLIDLFDGQKDLVEKRLRHTSPAFVEDPLRLLRTARFAARLDFEVDIETIRLMQQMTSSGELATLNRERIWKELADAIEGQAPWRFFEVLQECDALQQLSIPISALADSVTALQRAAAITKNPVVRVAAVLYKAAVDKGGAKGLEQAMCLPADHSRLLDALLRNAKDVRLAVVGNAESILKVITELRAEQQPEREPRRRHARVLLA